MALQNGKHLYQILLAEDSAADVGLVRMALRNLSFDYALHVAEDGAKAIAFIMEIDKNSKSRGLDLLLLDMHLPKRDGEEILRALRSTERCAQTPVVVLTSSDAPRDKETAQKHAAYDYFKKPSQLSDFLKLGTLVHDILSRCPPGDPNNPEADAA
jgi:CheY-like chemotaxis protein